MEITVKGNPTPKNRPRFARSGCGVKTYSDQKIEENKFIIDVLKSVKYINPSLKPIKLTVDFFLKRPKKHYGTGKNTGKLKPSAYVIHTKKPDIDNLLKFVMDCMNGILWKDDNQVYSITANKYYSEDPCTVIFMEES